MRLSAGDIYMTAKPAILLSTYFSIDCILCGISRFVCERLDMNRGSNGCVKDIWVMNFQDGSQPSRIRATRNNDLAVFCTRQYCFEPLCKCDCIEFNIVECQVLKCIDRP